MKRNIFLVILSLVFFITKVCGMNPSKESNPKFKNISKSKRKKNSSNKECLSRLLTEKIEENGTKIDEILSLKPFLYTEIVEKLWLQRNEDITELHVLDKKNPTKEFHTSIKQYVDAQQRILNGDEKICKEIEHEKIRRTFYEMNPGEIDFEKYRNIEIPEDLNPITGHDSERYRTFVVPIYMVMEIIDGRTKNNTQTLQSQLKHKPYLRTLGIVDLLKKRTNLIQEKVNDPSNEPFYSELSAQEQTEQYYSYVKRNWGRHYSVLDIDKQLFNRLDYIERIKIEQETKANKPKLKALTHFENNPPTAEQKPHPIWQILNLKTKELHIKNF